MNKNKLLIIGLVWPEPSSSAAGTRMVQLIELFGNAGYELLFASAASKSTYSHPLAEMGVTEVSITLNDSSFNLFLKETDPQIVLFDRFVMEEQYGWRVTQECPDALKLLDTEDLHCLRYARQQAIKSGSNIAASYIFSDMAKREIAAILRCDLSLIISELEVKLLHEQFHIHASLLYYLPFLEEELTTTMSQHWKAFEEREGFVFIGNYLHEPNWHTLQVLKTKIWPILRQKLPHVKLHVYGAYATSKVMQLHNPKENFYVHGRANHARETISQHRILLAPIQFGAGVKGKFIDAMQVGTPAVTTPIGAEAMHGRLPWNGVIADNPEIFINEAIFLYQDKQSWQQAQHNGIQLLNERYGKQQFINPFLNKLEELTLHLVLHRQQNFFGQILQHHTANSAKYMSLWIEEKNRKQP
jgi:glycosyltransferase involved in cell wall biosynthesis